MPQNPANTKKTSAVSMYQGNIDLLLLRGGLSQISFRGVDEYLIRFFFVIR
jgi:hypothetical protein